MQEKKKIKNKENFQPIKKTTIQQINYTEQLRIPTLNTIDLKNFGKSIEIKKQKKPASRKSRCVSVKQTCTSVKQTTTQPIKYKQLLKQFQQLKLLQEKSKSKQKSSKSSLSQSKRKSNSRKYNLITLMTKSNSRPSYCNSQFNLTQKLQKTLKKFNQTDYFKDQDQLIPFVSTSQPYIDEEAKNYEISNINNEEEINILQMRRFCRHKEEQLTDNEFSFKRNIQYFKGDQYEMMAIKIQRAWRQYRTKKLVQQYAGIFYQQQNSEDYLENYDNLNKKQENNSASQNNIESDKQNQIDKARYLEGQSDSYQQQQDQQIQKLRKRNYQKQGIIKTSQLYLPYELQQQQHKITYISNLQSQSQIEHNGQDFDLDLNLNQKIKQKQKNSPQIQERYLYQNNEDLNNQNELRTSYEQIINQIKKKQLIKWNQVIQLLSSNKSNSDPKRLQQLLQTLAFQSERNKKELQFKTEEILQEYHEKDRIDKWNHQSKIGYSLQSFQLEKSERQEQDSYLNNFQFSKKNKQSQKQRRRQREGLRQKEQLQRQRNNNYKQESGPSQLSDFKKEEEFDSRKYIQYLDSDMFNIDRERSSDNSSGLNNDERFTKKISKRKQQQLLATLQYEEMPLRLGKHSYSKSQCLQYSIQQPSAKSKNFLRLSKSNSQKNIDKVIKSISPNLLNYDKFQNQRQIDTLNIDLIRKQFLQNADPLEQLQRLHKQDQLRIKICESLQEYSINQNKQEPKPIQYSRDYQTDFQPQRAVTHIDLSKNTKTQNSKKDNIGISVQQIDRNISSSDESEDDEEDQKVSNVSFMIFNFLVFQLLKEMAVHDSILDMFKSYSLKQKNKNKKDDIPQKKGFSTTHHEVKSFVQGLVDYLLNEQPQVFKNLQVSAGPSALQMLHYMHPCQEQESIINQSQDDQSAVMVIPNRIFQTYWKIKQKSLMFQNKDTKIAPEILIRRKQNFEYIKGFNKIFCRSIFDTFNECLDFQRNFGQAGRPFPWKKTPSFFHNKALSEINKSIQISQKKIMEISMTYCGIIIEPSDMGKMSIEEGEQYLQHVQEDRMSRMLAQDLVQGQQKWTFYDDQQTEILVEIGNTLAMQLIFEACAQIEEKFSFFL